MDFLLSTTVAAGSVKHSSPTHSDGDTELTETEVSKYILADDRYGLASPLPAIQLSEFRGLRIYDFAAFAFVAVIVGLCAGIASWLPGYRLPHGDSLSNDCNVDPTSAVERNFLINIRVVDSLTFTQAKLLDLAWDLFIGQGGRLLHAWVLYHVATRLLTWMMEFAGVPYDVPMTLAFESASLSSLRSTLRALVRGQPRFIAVRLVMLLYAIAHVVAFATLWSAATGYLTPSVPTYIMPDMRMANTSSDDLRMCWVVDPTGLGKDVPSSGIVLGPRFGELYRSFEELSWLFTGQWQNYINSKPKVDDRFNEIYACKYFSPGHVP
jgi:hypothetical protein